MVRFKSIAQPLSRGRGATQTYLLAHQAQEKRRIARYYCYVARDANRKGRLKLLCSSERLDLLFGRVQQGSVPLDFD